jgi:hypothetical protein
LISLASIEFSLEKQQDDVAMEAMTPLLSIFVYFFGWMDNMKLFDNVKNLDDLSSSTSIVMNFLIDIYSQ